MFSEKSPSSPEGRSLSDRLAESVIEQGRDGFAGGYVRLLRGARRVARKAGIIDALDRRRHRPGALFARSLFAVHDIEELGALDLPWWTFGAVARVDAFLRARSRRARAFEWGAGASTVWLSRRCRDVSSVEHDAKWWPPLAAHLDQFPNVEARLIVPTPSDEPECPAQRAGWSGLDFAPYVRAIRDAGGPFDLIVIDGRARPSCLAEAVHHLADEGLIVFDNTHRRRYAAGVAASGLVEEPIGGFAPAVPWPSRTSLLARHEDVLRSF